MSVQFRCRLTLRSKVKTARAGGRKQNQGATGAMRGGRA